MKKTIGRTFLVASALLLSIRAASAQNLVSNGNFDTNVIGWVPESAASLEWDGALGSPGPGSARITNTDAGPGQGHGISQCLGTVTAGRLYNWGGRLYFPSGQARTGSVQIGLRWLNGPGCTGSDISQPRLSTTAQSSWVPLTASNQPAPAGAVSVQFVAFTSKVEAGGTLAGNFDTLFFGPSDGLLTPCVADAITLCLNGGRFSVTATWQSATASGPGMAVPITSDTGAFWFFTSGNLEGIFKLVNGCGFNNFYWFFAGGLTNVRVTLRVVDTATGVAKIYENPLNTAFLPIQDTAAFPCP